MRGHTQEGPAAKKEKEMKRNNTVAKDRPLLIKMFAEVHLFCLFSRTYAPAAVPSSDCLHRGAAFYFLRFAASLCSPVSFFPLVSFFPPSSLPTL